MADSRGGGRDCTRCCCNFLLTCGLTALFLWLSLRTYKPSLFIQDFYVHALNTSAAAAARSNHSIAFTLRLKNEMKDKGVGYANISITFFFNSSIDPIANYTVPHFYQGHGKTARRRDLVQAAGLPWAAALAAVANGSSVNFRVKVATKVRPKIMLWFYKRESLVVAGDVAVDGTGGKVKKKKQIKLKSAGSDPVSRRVGIGVVFTLFLVFFL